MVSFVQAAVIIEVVCVCAYLIYKNVKPLILVSSGVLLFIFTLVGVNVVGFLPVMDYCGIEELIAVNQIGCSPAIVGFSYALILAGLVNVMVRSLRSR